MTPKIIVCIYNETACIYRDQVPLTDSYLRYYVHTFYRTGRKPPYECRLPSAQMLLYFVLMTVTLKVFSPLKIKNGRTDILYLIVYQIEGQALPSISNITQVKRECKHFLNFFEIFLCKRQEGFEPPYPFGLPVFKTGAPPVERLQLAYRRSGLATKRSA